MNEIFNVRETVRDALEQLRAYRLVVKLVRKDELPDDRLGEDGLVRLRVEAGVDSEGFPHDGWFGVDGTGWVSLEADSVDAVQFKRSGSPGQYTFKCKTGEWIDYYLSLKKDGRLGLCAKHEDSIYWECSPLQQLIARSWTEKSHDQPVARDRSDKKYWYFYAYKGEYRGSHYRQCQVKIEKIGKTRKVDKIGKIDKIDSSEQAQIERPAELRSDLPYRRLLLVLLFGTSLCSFMRKFARS